jgi:hypothetical protein
MRNRLGILVATIAVAATPLVVAAPAQADTPTCVSRSEFRAVQKGWSITRVHRKLDVSGKQAIYFPAFPELGIPAEQTREYKPCASRYGYVSIDFKRVSGTWKLSSKMAFWG